MVVREGLTWPRSFQNHKGQPFLPAVADTGAQDWVGLGECGDTEVEGLRLGSAGIVGFAAGAQWLAGTTGEQMVLA